MSDTEQITDPMANSSYSNLDPLGK